MHSTCHCEMRRVCCVLYWFYPDCGPVAQLGARFHGMEEVESSNLSRSTKNTLPISTTSGLIFRVCQIGARVHCQHQARNTFLTRSGPWCIVLADGCGAVAENAGDILNRAATSQYLNSQRVAKFMGCAFSTPAFRKTAFMVLRTSRIALSLDPCPLQKK
jgi:hypothetical protein